TRCLILTTIVSFALVNQSIAQQPPSYAKQIKPFLARYCLECHSSDEPQGGLSMESFKSLMEGGGRGKPIVPGNPDKSSLVLQVEGKTKPFMPPKKAKQPKREEIGIVRAWVAAGAKDDSASVVSTLPEIKPRVPVAPPVSALAYRADSKMLAAGGHREVALIALDSGEVTAKLPDQSGKVTAGVFFAPCPRPSGADGGGGADRRIQPAVGS